MARRKPQKPEQIPLDLRPRKWGGKRDNAGRKPKPGKRSVPHRARPKHRSYFPLHVTMRAGVRGLRKEAVFARLRGAIAGASGEAFRVVHFSVQDNHLHLLVEAKDKRELTRGMRGLAVRAAQRINGALRRRGQVFSERYHARELTRPRAVRNALVYILHNHRRHGVSLAWLDPRSSASDFDGWRRDLLLDVARVPRAGRSRAGPAREERPVVAAARTWLASIGWRRAGLLGLDESPAKPG
jgi:REP element-mobilizing transposase RayT